MIESIVDLMRKDHTLSTLSYQKLREINQILVIFIGGIVDRSISEKGIISFPDEKYINMLRIVTKSIIHEYCIKDKITI